MPVCRLRVHSLSSPLDTRRVVTWDQHTLKVGFEVDKIDETGYQVTGPDGGPIVVDISDPVDAPGGTRQIVHVRENATQASSLVGALNTADSARRAGILRSHTAGAARAGYRAGAARAGYRAGAARASYTAGARVLRTRTGAGAPGPASSRHAADTGDISENDEPGYVINPTVLASLAAPILTVPVRSADIPARAPPPEYLPWDTLRALDHVRNSAQRKPVLIADEYVQAYFKDTFKIDVQAGLDEMVQADSALDSHAFQVTGDEPDRSLMYSPGSPAIPGPRDLFMYGGILRFNDTVSGIVGSGKFVTTSLTINTASRLDAYKIAKPAGDTPHRHNVVFLQAGDLTKFEMLIDGGLPREDAVPATLACFANHQCIKPLVECVAQPIRTMNFAINLQILTVKDGHTLNPGDEITWDYGGEYVYYNPRYLVYKLTHKEIDYQCLERNAKRTWTLPANAVYCKCVACAKPPTHSHPLYGRFLTRIDRNSHVYTPERQRHPAFSYQSIVLVKDLAIRGDAPGGVTTRTSREPTRSTPSFGTIPVHTTDRPRVDIANACRDDLSMRSIATIHNWVSARFTPKDVFIEIGITHGVAAMAFWNMGIPSMFIDQVGPPTLATGITAALRPPPDEFKHIQADMTTTGGQGSFAETLAAIEEQVRARGGHIHILAACAKEAVYGAITTMAAKPDTLLRTVWVALPPPPGPYCRVANILKDMGVLRWTLQSPFTRLKMVHSEGPINFHEIRFDG